MECLQAVSAEKDGRTAYGARAGRCGHGRSVAAPSVCDSASRVAPWLGGSRRSSARRSRRRRRGSASSEQPSQCCDMRCSGAAPPISVTISDAARAPRRWYTRREYRACEGLDGSLVRVPRRRWRTPRVDTAVAAMLAVQSVSQLALVLIANVRPVREPACLVHLGGAGRP